MKKFGGILSKHQKLRIVELVILMIIGGVMETFSVALIMPFMNVVMEPEKTMENSLVQFVCEALGIDSPRGFLVLLAIVLAVLFLLKNVFLLFEYNFQYRFVYGNMFMMQERLLSNLIHRPYEYFLKINSGEVIRIVNTDTPNTFILLTTLLQMFTEIVVSGMMIIAVFIIAPMITLAMAVILLLMLVLITLFMKPIQQKAGKETQASSAGMNKWLLQSVQGIKELKVTARENYFENKFNHYGSRYVNALRRNQVFSVVPRFIIEAVSMCAMFGIVAVLIWQGTDLEAIIPILTAVAMAAMRLLPSINRISQSMASVSYNEPMLDKLIENLKDISGEKNVSLGMELEAEKVTSSGMITRFEQDIRLSGITYRYPEAEKPVLTSTGMVIAKGQSAGIIGSSGAGKTTAVDVLLGFLEPEEGQVLLDGIDIREDMPGFLKQVGYIPQSIFMLDGTVRENVAFGEEEVSDDEVWRALQEASLFDFVKGLPEGVDTEIGERGVRLSGGQRQRIGIARALYRNPAILVFDEATSALDNETEKSIMESINHLKGQKTMIIIAHRLTTIENCDVVFRVEEGEIRKERG